MKEERRFGATKQRPIKIAGIETVISAADAVAKAQL